ncbi:hypothetical protein AGABI1DRAFT_95250 [Agaricus bisporus var. burnettii JB137-S8]|uniref:Uncharacterized protein n=1 Tax=Agaricus bisporus var. burnettii (strain JB137-S8 / ATCC MYA-4627 / FGSC 10392) TaxID=597362 RepID=K5WI31_AGABU|nr:uncharacterized protein AGABI1DRAFT_95250 [Agaricus bisporus var. burnettii JB137-S8]EKM74936.1 hypothetical protein AGABI1DRAFT_95250 [Agaricus bisporus var. burnettii JB137-S8]
MVLMGTRLESFLNSLVIGDTEGCRAGVPAIERVKVDTEIRNLRDEIFRSANSLLVGSEVKFHPRIRGRTSRSMTEVCFLNLVYNLRTNGDDLFEEFGWISIRRRMRTWVEHGSRIDIRDTDHDKFLGEAEEDGLLKFAREISC